MEGTNAFGGGLQSAHDALADALDGPVDLGGADAQLGDVGVIEGAGEVAQGGVTARANILDDPLDDGLGTEIRAEGLAYASPHARRERVRVQGHEPAPDKQRLTRGCGVRKASDHARASHGSRSIANSVS